MRKSFTRLLGLLMLVCMMSFNVVAQTLSPIDGFANVDWRLSEKNSTGVTFTLTFAQDVFPGRTGAGVIALSNSSYVQMDPIQITGTTSTNPVSGSTVVINGKTVTITFKSNDLAAGTYRLTEGSKYYITASPDAIEYANASYWTGLKAYPGVHDYDFTAGDYTSPVVQTAPVTGFFPVDGSTAFALAGVPSVTFSENIMYGTTGSVAIYTADGAVVHMFDLTNAATKTNLAAPGAGKLGIVGKTLYIQPAANLKELTNYYIRISADAISDLSVNSTKYFAGINNNTIWNFTSKDVTAPSVAFMPEDTKDRISNGTFMVLTFSDNRVRTAGEGINDADLAFDLYKVAGLVKLNINDDVTSLITLREDPTGTGTSFVALGAADFTAKLTTKNVVTITMNAAYNGATGKLKSGARYEYGVKAASLCDVENNAMPLTTVWYKADDTTAPTVTADFVYPGGTSGVLAVAPYNLNNTAGDLETTKVYFGVNATDIDVVSSIETKPTVVKYIVDVPATNYTQANILDGGVVLAAIDQTTNYYKHGTFIDKDKNGTTLASGTAYKISYVITDAKGNTSAVRTLTVTTNDILAPTYTVVYKKGVVESPSTAVVKDALIEITFNEDVLDKNGVTFSATTFDDAFELKRTDVSPAVTLVEGAAADFTINALTNKVFQIIGTSKDAGKPAANWISKGAYTLKFKDGEVIDGAKLAGPVTGTKNELKGAATHGFTVKDYEGPTAVFNPIDNATLVDNNGNITITFSEVPYFNGAPLTDADADALIALRKGDGSGASTASPLVPRTVKVVGNVVTITPTTKPLDSEIWYRVSVTTTDIKDVNGYVFNKYDNTVGPIVAFQEYANFKTKDNRSPLISFTTVQAGIVKGLANVPSDVVVRITLDESVRMVAGNTAITAADLNRIRPLISLSKVGGGNVEFDITVSTIAGAPATTVIELNPIDYNPNPFLFDKLATYKVSMTGLEDAMDNAVSGEATFTVEDNSPLTYTTSPANAATAVAKAGNIVLSFSSAVTKTAVAGSFITLFNNATLATDFSIDVTAAGVVANGSTQVVVSYSGLSANTSYTLNVPVGVFTATSNGKTNTLVVPAPTFTTVDEQGPAIDFGLVASVTPDESVPNTLAINSGKLSMVFDEDVLPGTGIILIRKPEAGAATTVAAINVQSEYVKVDPLNKKKIDITIPATLAYSQNYFVEMPQTSFKDAAGNSFRWADADHAVALHVADVTAPSPFPTPYVLGSATWDFSTVADVAPTYVLGSMVPKTGANSVALDSDLKITFSEPVTLATTGTRRLTIYDPSVVTSHYVIYLADVITTGDWNAARTELTIRKELFKDFVANTNYEIQIDAATFVDATSLTTAVLNSTYGVSGWYFTTSDTTLPTATIAAASGAALTAVKLDDNIILTFSETVSLNVGFTWNNAFTINGVNGVYVATMAADNKTVTINPNSNFISLTPATLELLGNAVKDAAGNFNFDATNLPTGNKVFNLIGEDKTAPSNVLATVVPYAKDKGKFTFTSNEKATLYYRISATALATVAEVKAGSSFVYDFAAPLSKDIEITGLEEFKSYTVYTVVEDLFGNVSAINSVAVKTTDVTNPTILSQYPAAGAVDVLYNNSLAGTTQLKLKLNFSEAIQFKAGSIAKIYIRDYATNVSKFEVAQAGMSIVSSTTPATILDVLEVTVPLGTLTDKTKYYIELDYNLLADKNNQTIGVANLDYKGAFIGKDVWTFTTADETLPALIGLPVAPATDPKPLYPVHDAAYANEIVPVEASNSFVMNFTEDVQLGTGFIYIYRYGYATPQEVINVTGGNVVVEGKKVTVKRYNKLQSETEYYVVVDPTAIKDLAPVANKFAGIAAPATTTFPLVAAGPANWTFKTKDITAPAVVLNPANNATGIDPAIINVVATAPSFSFQDPMNGNVAEQIYEFVSPNYVAVANGADKKAWFSVKANGVGGTILGAVYDNATHKFNVTIAAPGYKSDTEYIVTLLAGKLFDQAGNAIAATEMKFNTKISTSPDVDFAVVKGGAEVVANNTAVVDIDKSTYVLVTFNRSMLKEGGLDQNVPMTAADLKAAGYVTFMNTTDAVAVGYDVEVVESGKVYKLKPSSELKSTKNYEVVWTANVTAGSGTLVKDNLYFPGGNKLDNLLVDRTAKFTVSDYDNPTWTAFLPADNGTPATLAGNIEITFNENIAVTSGGYVQIRYGNGQIFQHILLTSDMIPTATKNKLSIPHNAFAANSTYYVVIPAGAITDASSNKNPYAGFSDDVTWNFSTDDGKEPRIKEVTASTALMVEPAQNASDVPVFSALKITFDENIIATAKNLVIYHNSGAKDDGFTDGNVWEVISLTDATKVKVSGSSIVNNLTSDVLTIQPARQFVKEAEGSNGKYYVRIEAGAVTDKSIALNPYKGINDNNTWSFTTANNTKPTLVSFTPVKGSSVAVDTDLTMTFDRNVLAGEGNIKVYQYYYNAQLNTPVEKLIFDIEAISENVIVSGKDVTVKLPSSLRDNIDNYYVLVDATAFTNTASSKDPFQGVTSPFTWLFKTNPDVIAPKLDGLLVDAVAPIDAKCLDKGAITLTMNFDEQVMLGTGKIRIFNAETNVEAEAIGAADIAKVTYLNDKKTVAVKTSLLQDNAKYYVKVDADAIKDRSTASVGDVPVMNVAGIGNFYAGIANKDWTFETGDFAAPVILTVAPSATNAIAYPVLTLTINENVVAGSGKISVTKNGATTAIFETVIDSSMISEMKVEVPVTARLADTTLYNVTFEGNLVQDIKECGTVLGNVAQVAAWSFTTGDNTAPIVTASPAGLTAAKTEFPVTFTFSEAVSMVDATTILVDGGSIVQGSFVDNGNNAYTVTLTGADEASVVVTFDKKIVDGNANKVDAQTSFTYVIGDNKAPLATGLFPQGEQGDYKNLALEIVFDDVVEVGTGAVKVYDAKNDSLIETIVASKFTSTDKKTYTSANLANVKFGKFYVMVDAGAFTDKAASTVAGFADFAGILTKTEWTFEVSDKLFADNACFKVSPVDGATKVKLEGLNLVIEFCSEDVVIGSLPFITIGENIGATEKMKFDINDSMISADGKTVTVPVTGLKENTIYTVVVPGGSITDEAGNFFNGLIYPDAWNFTTEDATSPVVSVVAATVNNEDGIATITSNEEGNVYLVEQAVPANLAQITAAISAKKAVAGVVYAANVPVIVSAKGLVAGTYQAIAIDAAGNIAVSTQKVVVENPPVVIEYKVVTIAQIQGTGANSPMANETVTTSGVVTGVDAAKTGFFMQDANKAWSGVYVADATWAAKVGIGTGLKVTGKISEVSGLTTIGSLIASETDFVAPVYADVQPITITADKVASEQYESVLVVLKDDQDGIATAPVNKEWTLTTNAKVTVTIDDQMYAYPAVAGNRYAVTGIVNATSASVYKVAPRYSSDIQLMLDVPELSSVFKVYPTLFENVINIKSTSEVRLTKAVFTNIAGQIVKEVINPESVISTSELRSGVYFISLHTENGIAKTERIIKR